MLKIIPAFFFLLLADVIGAVEHPTAMPGVKILFASSSPDLSVRHFLHQDSPKATAAVFGERNLEKFANALGFEVVSFLDRPPTSMPEARVLILGAPPAGSDKETLAAVARSLARRGRDLIVHPEAVPWFAGAVFPSADFVYGCDAENGKGAAGKLTICIPDGSALHVRGSEITGLGLNPLQLLLAKSKNRQPRMIPLKNLASHDYMLLSRAARERAGESPFPPEKPAEPKVAGKGALVLCGGGKSPRSALRWMLDRAGGPDHARLVVIPTARTDDELKIDEALKTFREIGFKKVTIAHVRRDRGIESGVSRQIDRANAVWFTGGRQWRLVDAYENGPGLAALHRLLERGGVIGGSSAGATICGDYLVRGDPRSSRIVSAEGYERGFCFLPGVAIDQHFAERNRFQDLEKLIRTYPQFLGIGLDESTAILVEGSRLSVRGLGNVTIFDRDPAKTPDGDLSYSRLKPFESYDLALQKPVD